MSTSSEIRTVRHRSRPLTPAQCAERQAPPTAPPLADDVSDAAPPSEVAPASAPTDYAVGYGRPPKQHRFKPGQSGNPRGRPKGARGVNATVRKTLETKVVVRTGGKVKKITSIEALLLKLQEKALQGDIRAVTQLIGLYRTAAPEEPASSAGTTADDLTDTDAAILELYRQRILDEQAAPGDAS